MPDINSLSSLRSSDAMDSSGRHQAHHGQVAERRRQAIVSPFHGFPSLREIVRHNSTARLGSGVCGLMRA